jgi:hypothetical protein
MGGRDILEGLSTRATRKVEAINYDFRGLPAGSQVRGTKVGLIHRRHAWLVSLATWIASHNTPPC